MGLGVFFKRKKGKSDLNRKGIKPEWCMVSYLNYVLLPHKAMETKCRPQQTKKPKQVIEKRKGRIM